MSYRSDVGLCLSARGRQALEEKIAELAPEDENTAIIKSLFENPRACEDGCAAWFWGGVKWYEDYADVAFTENFIKALEEEDYLFLLIGESDDDTEHRGGFWENPFGMTLIREIVFDS